MMSCFLVPIFFILFASSLSLADQDEDDFIKTCPPTTCGSGPGSLQIRYPFRLQSAPALCGLRDLHLICSGNDTLLTLPNLPPFKVTAINYKHYSSLSIDIGPGFGSFSSSCPFKNLSALDLLNTPRYGLHSSTDVRLFSCSRKPDLSSDSSDFVGPIACLSRLGYFVYAVDGYTPMGVIPSGCVAVEGGGEFQYSVSEENFELFSEKREVDLYLNDAPEVNYKIGYNCEDCEERGELCGYIRERNDTFCYSVYSPNRHDKGSGVMLIADIDIVDFFSQYVNGRQFGKLDWKLPGN